MARLFSLLVLVCLAVSAVLANPRPEVEYLSYGVTVNGRLARSDQCPVIFNDDALEATANLNLLCREFQDSDDDVFNAREEVAVAENSMSYNGQSENIQVYRYDAKVQAELTTELPDAPRN